MSILAGIRGPLGIVILLVLLAVFATLTVAAAISGALTDAAVSGAGLLVIVIILAVIKSM